MSPFFKVTGSALMVEPLRVGLLLPSTCATTKPCGRLVIAATATPGLPIVVTTLTRGTSRPAAAPDSTLIAAARLASSAVAAAVAPSARAAPAGTTGAGGIDPALMIIVFSYPGLAASLMF